MKQRSCCVMLGKFGAPSETRPIHQFFFFAHLLAHTLSDTWEVHIQELQAGLEKSTVFGGIRVLSASSEPFPPIPRGPRRQAISAQLPKGCENLGTLRIGEAANANSRNSKTGSLKKAHLFEQKLNKTP